MTLARAADLVADAVVARSAVPAFNAIGLEHAEAIVAGATSAGTGALIQLSENAIAFRGSPWPLLAACRELAIGAGVPIGIHLDHIAEVPLAEALIDRAAEFGVGSIMIDASEDAYADNVRITRDVVERGHAAGIWVEAELGEIGGKDGAHAPGVRTDPDEAAEFVAATGVDALAVAVGSVHAMRDRSASLDLGLISLLAAAVPVPLVLHGSSGVADDVIAQGVAAGIRKVNVGTALNLASTAALREALAERPDAVDPRRYTAAPRGAMADLVAAFCAVVRQPATA
jgi:fructose-bisphosphate aldolase, class II